MFTSHGCDNITAGRRAAGAKDGRTRGELSGREAIVKRERRTTLGDVVAAAIKIGTAAMTVCM